MSDIHKNLRDTIRENLIQQNYPIAEKNLSILVRQADAHLQLTLLRREIGEKPDILNRLDQLEKKIIPPGTLEQKYEILAKKIIPNNIPLVSDHKNIALGVVTAITLGGLWYGARKLWGDETPQEGNPEKKGFLGKLWTVMKYITLGSLVVGAGYMGIKKWGSPGLQNWLTEKEKSITDTLSTLRKGKQEIEGAIHGFQDISGKIIDGVKVFPTLSTVLALRFGGKLTYRMLSGALRKSIMTRAVGGIGKLVLRKGLSFVGRNTARHAAGVASTVSTGVGVVVEGAAIGATAYDLYRLYPDIRDSYRTNQKFQKLHNFTESHKDTPIKSIDIREPGNTEFSSALKKILGANTDHISEDQILLAINTLQTLQYTITYADGSSIEQEIQAGALKKAIIQDKNERIEIPESEIRLESSPAPQDFTKKNIDYSKQDMFVEYITAIQYLKRSTDWSQIQVEINIATAGDQKDTITLARIGGKQDISLERQPDNSWDLFVNNKAIGTGGDLYQSIALANLVNKTAEIELAQSLVSPGVEKFYIGSGARDGNIMMIDDATLAFNKALIEDAFFFEGWIEGSNSYDWLDFYHKNLSISSEAIIDVLNAWFTATHKK